MMQWINDFNVIYKGELYRNCVSFVPFMYMEDNVITVKETEILYIDENGSIKAIRDKAELFKFVRK